METLWNQWLLAKATARDSAGLTRRLHPRTTDDAWIDLAGNDYLGLSGDPRVVAAAQAATRTWGAGAGASRLVTGTTALHADLEHALARLVGAEQALVTSTGYHANLAAITALADRETTVISDGHAHASLIDGIRLSRARVQVVPHNDLDGFARALAETEGRRIVVVESVYSVLGDAAPLAELVALTAEHQALLVVDEAHALGIHGEGAGLLAELGRSGHDHVVLTGTLSKALGAQGGVVAGSEAIITHLVNTARPFIFDTGLAPAAAGAAVKAVELVHSEPARRSLGQARARQVAALLDVPTPAGWVMSRPMASPAQALATQARLLEEGVRVGCFRPPSTPDQIARLRVTINAGVEEHAWQRAMRTLERVLATGEGDDA